MRKIKLSLLLAAIIIVPLFESCKQVEQVTHDAMEYSLNKLGDTFFSLIADSPEKDEMRKKYDSFVQKSVDGEVEQEQIEYVAANMLNISNSHNEIKPQLAANIVEATQPMNQSPSDNSQLSNESGRSLDESSRKSLGDKLSKILDFNEKLTESYSDSDISDKVFYRFDEGIEIDIDEELKSALEEMEKSFEDFSYIQKEMDLTWVKDLSENLKIEQANFMEEMKKLENMKFEFKDFMKDGKFTQFYFNDSSFVMPDIPQVNMDSIMESVQQSLRDAGIDTNN